MSQRVLLMGKGELAVRCAAWFADSPEHELETIVPVMPEPTWTASLSAWARANGVELVESGDYRDTDPTGYDLAMSVFYDKIIKPDFIDASRRILNLHNGPLPRYRGVSPINWALKNGEDMHGVTIHEIWPGVDDGAIISQVQFSIYPEQDEVEDVYRRALEFGWTLFQQTIPLLDRIPPRLQRDEDALTYTRTDDPRLGDRRSFTRAASS